MPRSSWTSSEMHADAGAAGRPLRLLIDGEIGIGELKAAMRSLGFEVKNEEPYTPADAWAHAWAHA